MRKQTYGNYINDHDIIQMCNEMNIYDITSTNIFRDNQFDSMADFIVLYDNNMFYIYRDPINNIFYVQTTYFAYDLNSKPQDNDNFNNLSYQDKQGLFYMYKHEMSIYENKDHPDILFGLSAFDTAFCIIHNGHCDIRDIDLGEDTYEADLFYY